MKRATVDIKNDFLNRLVLHIGIVKRSYVSEIYSFFDFRYVEQGRGVDLHDSDKVVESVCMIPTRSWSRSA